MTFDEALEKLKKIAKKEFCSLEYSVDIFASGGKKVSIKAYINGYNYTKSCQTFYQALTEMRKQVNPEKYELQPDDPQIRDTQNKKEKQYDKKRKI